MKQNQNMRVGIIGTGWIADKAAITLNGLQQCDAYAVGSRSQLTADAFAQKWNISRAYGSYAELIADPNVDLIYVGTPHSHHYDVTKEALLAGKPCLVEKAFMANARQTKEAHFDQKKFSSKQFQDMWKKINQQTYYTVDFKI